MRLIVGLIAAIGIFFMLAVGFYWWRDGSLESAGATVGAKVDEGVEALDRSTESLRDEVGDVGDAAVESIQNATDGDDRT